MEDDGREEERGERGLLDGEGFPSYPRERIQVPLSSRWLQARSARPESCHHHKLQTKEGEGLGCFSPQILHVEKSILSCYVLVLHSYEHKLNSPCHARRRENVETLYCTELRLVLFLALRVSSADDSYQAKTAL